MAHTVLVVDDDPVVHCVLRRLLEGTEYHLARANNGREALELATRDLPQLIILDVLMQDPGGWRCSGSARRPGHQRDSCDRSPQPHPAHDAIGSNRLGCRPLPEQALP